MDIKKILESMGINVSDLEKVAAAIADISEVKMQQAEINKSLQRIESKLDYLIEGLDDETYEDYIYRTQPEALTEARSELEENSGRSDPEEAHFTAHNLVNENIGKS